MVKFLKILKEWFTKLCIYIHTIYFLPVCVLVGMGWGQFGWGDDTHRCMWSAEPGPEGFFQDFQNWHEVMSITTFHTTERCTRILSSRFCSPECNHFFQKSGLWPSTCIHVHQIRSWILPGYPLFKTMSSVSSSDVLDMGMIRPVLKDTRTLSPSSVYRHSTVAPLLEQVNNNYMHNTCNKKKMMYKMFLSPEILPVVCSQCTTTPHNSSIFSTELS